MPRLHPRADRGPDNCSHRTSSSYSFLHKRRSVQRSGRRKHRSGWRSKPQWTRSHTNERLGPPRWCVSLKLRNDHDLRWCLVGGSRFSQKTREMEYPDLATSLLPVPRSCPEQWTGAEGDYLALPRAAVRTLRSPRKCCAFWHREPGCARPVVSGRWQAR
jgi:hypothetical protein